MGNQLSAGLVASDEVVHDESDKSIRVRILLVLEIEPIVSLSDGDGLIVGIMFQNHLLQEEESTLVVDALSELNL